MKYLKQAIIKNLFAGLTVLIPLYLTVYILSGFVGFFDDVIRILPGKFNLDRFQFPGLGLILVFLLASSIGLVVRNYLGRNFLQILNSTIERVPIVAGIYSLLRQVSETMLGQGSKSFSRVVLVEWPRKECWVIAFITADSDPYLVDALEKKGRWVNVFVPATPNPTSGFYFMVPESDVVELKISVDQAFKVILSAGSIPIEIPKHS